MTKRIFTPQEANKRLPLVKKIVGEILEKGKTVRDLLEQSQGREHSRALLELQEEIEILMGELEELGCYYKDWNFSVGLVDFPAMIEGEAVFLCWRSDEPSVRWYHPMESGYTGRKPIPDHLLRSDLN